MAVTRIIGANQEPIKGSGTIVHDGGDPLLIAPLEDGMAGAEETLTFGGVETVVDGDDIFKPADKEARTYKFDGPVLVRALGQANITVEEKAPAKKEAKVAATAS